MRPQITFLPNAHVPSEVQRRLRAYDKEVLQRRLDELDDYGEEPCRRGRPEKEVPADLARRMVADLGAGRSQRYVWRKYRKVYPFGRKWLAKVVANGRLALMASKDMAVA